MNPSLSNLHPYPFEKLAQLKKGITPPEGLPHIALSIGEPQHPAPQFVAETLISHQHLLSVYPTTRGLSELRQAIADWLVKRFSLPTGSVEAQQHVLPVNGTREALFAIAQAVVDSSQINPLVLMPNPFYQIYEGAAILAGAQPRYLNCYESSQWLPEIDQVSAAEWQNCQLLYLCNPGNPSGAVMPPEYLQRLIELSQQYDFVLASDECYSEIYFDEASPPTGLLGEAANMGLDSYNNCLVFHSLSKRSNLPGLRSGFVAGDARLIKNFLVYRTYHGCAMPVATQLASAAAWQDEAHVVVNRQRYREKFEQVLDLLSATLQPQKPDAGFYLWPETPIADTDFSQRLFAEQNVTVLPGQFLSRTSAGSNPGENRIRMALVAPLDECRQAAERINSLFQSL